jgi:hypothetical protein
LSNDTTIDVTIPGRVFIRSKIGGYAPDHFEIESIVEHAKNIAEVESGMIQFAAARLRLYRMKSTKRSCWGHSTPIHPLS